MSTKDSLLIWIRSHGYTVIDVVGNTALVALERAHNRVVRAVHLDEYSIINLMSGGN